MTIISPLLSGEPMEVPVASSDVSAGFPSPAADYAQTTLDLNRELIKNPASTFFARVSGVSMVDADVDEGDLLVVDRSVEPTEGCMVVCYIDGEFTLKRLSMTDRGVVLLPANENYSAIEVGEESDFEVWGVVTYVIKRV